MTKFLFNIFILILIFSCSRNENLLPDDKIGKIILNPTGQTPLSLVYKTETNNNYPVTVITKGMLGNNDIIFTYPKNYGSNFAIHGMYSENTNTIYIINGTNRIATNIIIDKLYIDGIYIPATNRVIKNLIPEENIYFNSINDKNSISNLKDNNEEIYFASPVINRSWKGLFLIGVSRNGNLRYVNYSNFYLTNEIAKVIDEDNDIVIYDTMGVSGLLGNAKLDITKLDIGVHHDTIRKKSDSNYIMLANSDWGVEDRICEVDNNGDLIRDLYVGDLIKKIVNKNGDEREKEYLKKLIFDEDNKYYSIGRKRDFPMDWAHCNSLVYDEANDILYLSVRSLAVMAIDYSEWELIWYMADDTLDTMEAYNPYGRYLKELKSFDPYKVLGDGNTDGPKSQHALFLISTNVIGMFDNQGDEDINPNGSRYVEYKITGSHGNWKAEKIYEYKTENKLYSHYISDIDFLSNGNMLLDFGNNSQIMEVNKETKEVYYHLEFGIKTWGIYRIDKMPFYYSDMHKFSKDCSFLE
ncbi:aryl-sulfate sulfotransferase [Brachyspira murdochii]|uniref:Arylsulfate sulfotransferase n=1 Tax=Brachyspira murdochii TaxID=84378 RepID=A0ABX5B5Q3_9SPIR|nr:aryl-sulfate sulfotransferase [Brachyspira murdochii]PPS21859.1 arylsulfate sulfotransferase [Brachyspira murdochii]